MRNLSILMKNLNYPTKNLSILVRYFDYPMRNLSIHMKNLNYPIVCLNTPWNQLSLYNWLHKSVPQNRKSGCVSK